MAENNKRIRFWRGTAESYERLKKAGALSYWTRYSVKYTNNGLVTWKEYYGDNPLTEETGQLLPVIDIVETLPSVLNPGDRYWISNGAENYIIEVFVGKSTDDGEITLNSRVIIVKEGISIRVKNKGYMAYLLLNNEVITYDEVNGGIYDN
jgi:hypothetical protein